MPSQSAYEFLGLPASHRRYRERHITEDLNPNASDSHHDDRAKGRITKSAYGDFDTAEMRGHENRLAHGQEVGGRLTDLLCVAQVQPHASHVASVRQFGHLDD